LCFTFWGLWPFLPKFSGNYFIKKFQCWGQHPKGGVVPLYIEKINIHVKGKPGGFWKKPVYIIAYKKIILDNVGDNTPFRALSSLLFKNK
jgi:hypothetical protein